MSRLQDATGPDGRLRGNGRIHEVRRVMSRHRVSGVGLLARSHDKDFKQACRLLVSIKVLLAACRASNDILFVLRGGACRVRILAVRRLRRGVIWAWAQRWGLNGQI